MSATTLSVKLNINKKEKKTLLSLNQKMNYVVINIGIFQSFVVGRVVDVNSISTTNEVECEIEDKFMEILKDRIDYLDFKQEYLTKQGRIVFQIKLKKYLSLEEMELWRSMFK